MSCTIYPVNILDSLRLCLAPQIFLRDRTRACRVSGLQGGTDMIQYSATDAGSSREKPRHRMRLPEPEPVPCQASRGDDKQNAVQRAT